MSEATDRHRDSDRKWNLTGTAVLWEGKHRKYLGFFFPIHYERRIMENRMNAKEKWASEQERAMAEVQMDIMKDTAASFKEKREKPGRGENSINDGGRREENLYTNDNRFDEEEVQRHWMKRVELPTFEGSAQLGWISREKLGLALMEGNASHRFKFWKQKTNNSFYEDMRTALNRRFGGKDRNTLVSQIPHISEEQLLVYFFAGLQNMICSQIRPHDLKDSILAIEIARDVEDSMKDASGRRVLYRNNNSNFLYQGGTRVVSCTKAFKGVGSSQQCEERREWNNIWFKYRRKLSGRPEESRIKRISLSRSIRRREEGAYSPGHHCEEVEDHHLGEEEEAGEVGVTVLEINLVTFPNVADATLAIGMFSHYYHPRIAHICEKAGFFIRALQFIALSKRDNLYKDCMETCSQSGDRVLSEDLLVYFIEQTSPYIESLLDGGLGKWYKKDYSWLAREVSANAKGLILVGKIVGNSSTKGFRGRCFNFIGNEEEENQLDFLIHLAHAIVMGKQKVLLHEACLRSSDDLVLPNMWVAQLPPGYNRNCSEIFRGYQN
ncbi:hypothetical protein V8G54_037513 [Vigna mungo]|uniref:Uncharacterized protein n=1 Tax=Vigna mungo TaxID=3915 RepID=A0AAQ3MJ91_VIGMU